MTTTLLLFIVARQGASYGPMMRRELNEELAAKHVRGRYGRVDHSLMGSPSGQNSAQLTAPIWPGSLYISLPLSFDQMPTVPSPAPTAILVPSASQLARTRFFSIPSGAPSKVRMCLSVGAKGRISLVRAVVSIEYDCRDCESGDTLRLVTVSWCPGMEWT